MPDQQPSPAASLNQPVIDEFRANGGSVGGMFEGVPLVLMTTAGRLTARPRTNPVTYLRDGHRYLIFGSNLGRPQHPGWYHNLLASPQVAMEIGTEDGGVKLLATRAVVLAGAERDRLYQRQCTISPVFREYQRKTTRKIPVVALYPLDLAEDPERSRLIGEQLIAHHNDLRAELAQVRARILGGNAEFGADGLPAADLAVQLQQHCLSYCYGLQLHHLREDGAFTAFERQFPHLVPAIGRLRSEHRRVAAALADLEALLSSADSGAHADVATLRGALDRVISGLEEHFSYEEHQLLPALNGTHPVG